MRDGENPVHTLGRSATEVFSSFRPRGGRGRQAESAVIRQGRCNDPEMVIPWKVPERMPNPKVTLTLSRASSVASVSIIQRRGSYNHLMALDFNIPLSLFPPSPPPPPAPPRGSSRESKESCSVIINASVSMTLPLEINQPEAWTDDKLIHRRCSDLLHGFRRSIPR